MAQSDEIFISYSWDSKEHIKKVLEFSNKLRSEGVDSVIDQYEASPSEGWPRWMESKIRSSKYVLLICTEEYYNRSIGKVDETVGNGVKWEGHLIFQHLYDAGSHNTKFIPVIFKESDRKYIPTPVRGSTIYNIETEEGYDNLYYRLIDEHRTPKPELGKRRPLPQKEVKTNPSMFIDTPINLELWNQAEWHGVVYCYGNQNIYDVPPSLGIIFKNKNAAENIFNDWKEKYGNVDSDDEIRVSIIEGDVEGEEPGYFVHITYDYDKRIQKFKKNGVEFKPLEDIYLSIGRFHRMTPHAESQNLALFKKAFNYFKRYTIFPCIAQKEDCSDLQLAPRLSLEKKEIIFKTVDEIGENDIDAVVLRKNVEQL